MAPQGDVTVLLQRLQAKDAAALDELLAVVYAELQQLAHRQLRKERADHTLNTTGLVHEAYLRMVPEGGGSWENRAHFFGTAARAMRQVLVDYARQRNRQKRGGPDRQQVPLETVIQQPARFTEHLLDLNEALEKLEAAHARYGRIIECRFFGGLTIQETAEAVGVSPATVKREWRFARAWLHNALH